MMQHKDTVNMEVGTLIGRSYHSYVLYRSKRVISDVSTCVNLALSFSTVL